MNRTQKIAALSPRARKLLAHVCAGKFYPYRGKDTPAAMEELTKAGLVRVGGRVEVMRACYVPVGTRPFRQEKYPTWAKPIAQELGQ